MKTRAFFLITLLCAALASLQSVNANTITVTNTNDSGAGSLRAALVSALDGDTINFSVTGTITLTSGQLSVYKSITISGPGANSLSVDGNHASTVFFIGYGKTVTISGLTITNGYSRYYGGNIYNDHAALTVTDSTISNSGDVGGVYSDGSYGSAALTVSNSTISGNSNYYSYSGGGGVYSDGSHGSATLTVSNSTISGNYAYYYGGGVSTYGFNGSATVTVSNSTISGNSAYYGGGVYNNRGAILSLNSTISANSARYYGGFYNAYATLTIGNTILNAGSSGTNIYNASGTVTSLGYNLSSDSGGGYLTATGDQINTDPLLGPLQDNGGPTFTHELLTGSPAIDAGDPSFTPPPDYDQRGTGFNRVVNRIDVGAFEVQTIVCPQLQGYWKNNPDEWPVTSLTLGSQTYTETELLSILRSRVRTDASVILAYQLIAAKLNIANGANGTPVTSTITDADAVLSLYNGMLPYRVRPNSTNGHRMVSDAAVLENYNKGLLTPGCTPTPTPTPSPTP